MIILVVMKQALIYSLKVWPTTIALWTFMYLMISWFVSRHVRTDYYVDTYWMEMDYCRMQIICFIPTLCLFIIATRYFNRKDLKSSSKKLYLTIAAALFCLTPFLITINDAHYATHDVIDIAELLCLYIFLATISIWFYKLKPEVKLQSN